MSTNSQDQEIDLGQVFKKIGSFFQLIIDKVFDFILFLKRNIIVIAILFIVGAVWGYFKDKDKSYTNEIIVQPNFGSVDYLYAKIALLDAKKKEKDTTFFTNIGFKDVKKIAKFKIEPIIDVYKFIDGENGNFEMIKLMAEDGNIDDIIKNQITSKNYAYHLITFTTSKKALKEDTVEPLLNYLNNSEYFSLIQKQYIKNQDIKAKANDSVINQIDKLIEGFSNSAASGSKTDKMVYISDNNQLDEIIKTKNNLIYEQGVIRISKLSNDKIIKEVSTTINSLNREGIQGKMKFILPLFLVFLFMMIVAFKNFYKKQLTKRNL